MTIEEPCPPVVFPVSWETFRRLPRHPGYRYEYRNGEACLTPHPRQYHCLLPLQSFDAATMIETPRALIRVRPLCEPDWQPLEAVFDRAFRKTDAPEDIEFLQTVRAGTDDVASGDVPNGDVPSCKTLVRDSPSRDALGRVRSGESGPLVRTACFVAMAGRPEEAGSLVGGLFVTLLPAGDLERFDDPVWAEPPPPDAIGQRWGRPHLTWVFVDPPSARRGIASLMLGHAARALRVLGYRELASTFLLGNEPSTLWHWRNGFRLASYVGSPRVANQRDAVESLD